MPRAMPWGTSADRAAGVRPDPLSYLAERQVDVANKPRVATRARLFSTFTARWPTVVSGRRRAGADVMGEWAAWVFTPAPATC